jgi:hypothetical protein
MKKIMRFTILIFLIGLVSGCAEQYALQSADFESALVVEATLTNELKIQEVKLSRTFRLEEDGPQPELGAQVSVSDDQGGLYNYSESGGIYRSDAEFRAEPGKTYTLTAMTSDGKTYKSRPETLTTVNEMEDVVASVQTIDGVRGVQVNAKAFDPTNTSKYYRYEYWETYKIIAPYWDFFKAELTPPAPGETHSGIAIVPRGPIETKTCFGTAFSNDIIQTSTNDLNEDRVDFTVRFISDQNPIISHRYSILVTQYVQSLPAFMFYKTLKELSGQGSILSQNQPGFFYGNIREQENPVEKVIGFFEVASVSKKRIYFNYADLFPDEPMPPYFTDCSLDVYKFCFSPTDMECRGGELLSAISTGRQAYLSEENNYYTMVATPCSDCTSLGSNIVPSFWQD